MRQQQENKIRHDLSNALLDSEADRKYFASELVKREALIDDLAREKNSKSEENEARRVTYDPLCQLDYQQFERATSDKMKLFQVIFLRQDTFNSFEGVSPLQNQMTKVEGHSMKEIERAKQLQTIEMQLEFEKRRALTEVGIFCPFSSELCTHWISLV